MIKPVLSAPDDHAILQYIYTLRCEKTCHQGFRQRRCVNQAVQISDLENFEILLSRR